MLRLLNRDCIWIFHTSQHCRKGPSSRASSGPCGSLEEGAPSGWTVKNDAPCGQSVQRELDLSPVWAPDRRHHLPNAISRREALSLFCGLSFSITGSTWTVFLNDSYFYFIWFGFKEDSVFLFGTLQCDSGQRHWSPSMGNLLQIPSRCQGSAGWTDGSPSFWAEELLKEMEGGRG